MTDQAEGGPEQNRQASAYSIFNKRSSKTIQQPSNVRRQNTFFCLYICVFSLVRLYVTERKERTHGMHLFFSRLINFSFAFLHYIIHILCVGCSRGPCTFFYLFLHHMYFSSACCKWNMLSTHLV